MGQNDNKQNGLANFVVKMAEEFKNSHANTGYSKMEVDYFLDELIMRVHSYKGKGMKAEDVDKPKMFEEKYQAESSVIIEDINNARFIQGFRGYNAIQVDEFLDYLVSLIKNNASYSDVRNMIDVKGVTAVKFAAGFNGYDIRQVDEFIDKMAMGMERLNEVKRRFI